MGGNKKQTPEATNQPTKEMLKIKAEKEFYAQNIKRLEDQMNNGLSEWSVSIVEERLLKVKSDFDKFEMKIKQIVCGNADASEKEAAQMQFVQMEALLFDLIDRMKIRVCEQESKAANKQTTTTSVTESIDATPKLEIKAETIEQIKQKFKIMKFFGEQSEWKMFKNWLVEKVIDNTEIEADNKFQIIREAVSGTQAEPLLDGVVNCEQAKLRLFKSFDSAYKIAQHEFRRIKLIKLNMKMAQGEALWNLTKEIDDCINVLSERNVMESFNSLLTLIVIDKLDRATQINWERHVEALSESWAINDQTDERKANDFIPNWENLRTFLRDEAKFWMAFERPASMKIEPGTSNASYAACVSNVKPSTSSGGFTLPTAKTIVKASSNVKCFVCEQNHTLKTCALLLNRPVAMRREIIENAGLCGRCLHPQHQGRCKEDTCNDPCPKCGPAVYHNSLLCSKTYTQQSMKKSDEDEWEY